LSYNVPDRDYWLGNNIGAFPLFFFPEPSQACKVGGLVLNKVCVKPGLCNFKGITHEAPN